MSLKYLPPTHIEELESVTWINGGGYKGHADINIACFFEMNNMVCFERSLPAIFYLHSLWGPNGSDAGKIKKSFQAVCISTGLKDYHWNNERRTKSWVDTQTTVGRVHDEWGSVIQKVEFPKDIHIGVDKFVKRSRNAQKIKKEALEMLKNKPWLRDPNSLEEKTLRNLEGYLMADLKRQSSQRPTM